MFDFLKPLVGGVVENLDKLITSDDERLKARNELVRLENDLEKSINEHVTEVVKCQKETLLIELNSGNWIARNWRPVLMFLIMIIIAFNYVILPFIGLIVNIFNLNAFPPAPEVIPDQLWSLLQISLGGYILGRSGEKIVSSWRK